MAEIRSAGGKSKQKTTRSPPKRVLETKADRQEVANAEVKQKPGQVNSDPRDSLLASIREAAGRPKRKAGTTTTTKSSKSKQTDDRQLDNQAPAQGGDLMSDLVNKLRARRDGISGSNQNKQLQPEEPVEASFGQAGLKTAGVQLKAEPLDTIQQRVMSQVSSLIPQMSAALPGDDERNKKVEEEDSDYEVNDDDWA